MTEITLQGGKVVMRGSAVGTGSGCCCGDNGCCVINGVINKNYTTQSECEQCTHSYMCSEEIPLPEGGCPEGYYEWGGFCFGERPVASCAECSGYCYENGPAQGPCGTWTTACHICCKPVDGQQVCSTEETTQEQCESVGGIWKEGGSCNEYSCAGCCCVNGAADDTKTTQQACQDAGGAWTDGGSCNAECSIGVAAHLTGTWVGNDCTQQQLAQTWKATVSGSPLSPCGTSARVGARFQPCGQSFDFYDITGVWKCNKLTTDAQGNCTASDCDWTDIVSSWVGAFGGALPQCDCVPVLQTHAVY